MSTKLKPSSKESILSNSDDYCKNILIKKYAFKTVELNKSINSGNPIEIEIDDNVYSMIEGTKTQTKRTVIGIYTLLEPASFPIYPLFTNNKDIKKIIQKENIPTYKSSSKIFECFKNMLPDTVDKSGIDNKYILIFLFNFTIGLPEIKRKNSVELIKKYTSTSGGKRNCIKSYKEMMTRKNKRKHKNKKTLKHKK